VKPSHVYSSYVQPIKISGMEAVPEPPVRFETRHHQCSVQKTGGNHATSFPGCRSFHRLTASPKSRNSLYSVEKASRPAVQRDTYTSHQICTVKIAPRNHSPESSKPGLCIRQNIFSDIVGWASAEVWAQVILITCANYRCFLALRANEHQAFPRIRSTACGWANC
jgi:hypothetical protein